MKNGEQGMTHQPAISFSNSFHFPFNRAGGRTSNVRQKNMNLIVDEIIGKIAPSVVAAIVASWVTVRLAFGRFKKENLWQRKLEAYSRILESLHVCRIRAERLMNESLRDIERNDEQTKEFDIEYSKATSDLHRMIDTGVLILPEEITTQLEAVMKPRFNDWKEMASYEFWDTEDDRMKNALKEVIKIARTDLKR